MYLLKQQLTNKVDNMSNSIFETKDLVVTSASIAQCHEHSVTEFFIDYKSGKGLSVCASEKLAIEFAIAFQKML